MEKILRTIESFIPKKVYRFFQPTYHFLLAFLGAIIYRNPSNEIFVIGVTGTKGKSSTVEFINAILEAANKKTAILSTIRFKVDNDSKPNKYKMTMPGRFFTQKFLRDAVDKKCEYAIVEMTSEGARFFRHAGIQMNALVFTNLSPEHIESHGSFKKYKETKLRLINQLARSSKPVRISIANLDDKHSPSFLISPIEKNIGYSMRDVRILSETQTNSMVEYKGVKINIPIPGKFNISNVMASLTLTEELGIPLDTAKKGIEGLSLIRGRLEKIDSGQNFTVIVDYAHTEDSLRKVFETFPSTRKIVVFGATGGGRDSWKRKFMGTVSDEFCDEIIITNDDPYDEDPEKIMREVAEGVKKHSPYMVLDRREAIRKGILLARAGDILIVAGKGTDPYIMGKGGSKIPWDDATVVREELKKNKK